MRRTFPPFLDLQRRYDEQYDTIEEIEVQIGELQSQIRSIQQEKISGDNIYRLLLAFDEVYHSATEAEQKEFMKAFIERIEMFPLDADGFLNKAEAWKRN